METSTTSKAQRENFGRAGVVVLSLTKYILLLLPVVILLSLLVTRLVSQVAQGSTIIECGAVVVFAVLIAARSFGVIADWHQWLEGDLAEYLHRNLLDSGVRQFALALGTNSYGPSLDVSGLGPVLSVSPNAIDHRSKESLLWQVKGLLLHHQRLRKRMVVCGLSFALVIPFGLALVVRQELAWYWYAAPFVIGLLPLVLLVSKDWETLIRIDQEITKTREDFLCAKEALSSDHFAFRSELTDTSKNGTLSSAERRARFLGISLERGFRADQEGSDGDLGRELDG